MSLRTKLMLAFLLLSVVPLTVITLYSYNSSIEAFRKAVEAESGSLADDMGGRMDSVRKELAYRVERLGTFPFRQLMAFRGERFDLQSNPLMADLMKEMGDTAGLVDSIEFHPLPGAPGVGPRRPRTVPSAPEPPRPPGAVQADPQGLVIHLSPETAGAVAASPPVAVGGAGAAMIHIHPTAPPMPQGALGEAERSKLEAQLKKIQEYRVVFERLGTELDRKKIDAEVKGALEAARKAGDEAARMQHIDPLAGDFGSVVKTDGAAVGTVTARVSPRQVFHDVLSRTRRRQGEIPFLIDTEGKLHTPREADQSQLQALDLTGAAPGSSKLKDWLVVTRQDPASKMTFGIARPVGSALREIRNTAARNLGLGLGMVGLALIGIIPLSNRMTRKLAALTQEAERLARGDLSARVDVRSHDEIGRLADAFNRMAHDLGENQKLLVGQESFRKELEMSRRIQEEMLPRQALQTGVVEAKGVSIPAREVGGDFFNYFPLPNEEVAILVGDVSGKGIAAALLMANLQATLQSRLPLGLALEELARQLDRDIEASTPPEVYLTLFMGVLDTRNMQLRYINAGHNTQFALHSDGKIERMASTGRPLGLLAGGDYVEGRVQLAEGDALFLYTDGLVDAEDKTGREFGFDRLETLLSGQRAGGVNDILSRVEDEIRQHRGQVEAADDATMLVMTIGTGA